MSISDPYLGTVWQTIQCKHVEPIYDITEDETSVDWDQCKRKVKEGNLCEWHANEDLGVRVMQSKKIGAGLGLFTTRDRKKGEYICDYEGTLKPFSEYENKDEDSYTVQLATSPPMVISARKSTDGFGRFINSPTNGYASSKGENCEFMSDSKYIQSLPSKVRGTKVKKRKSRPYTIVVVAKKKIESWQELYTDYGDEYWESTEDRAQKRAKTS